tara:strand:- start:1 stop:273 length:273 start_codon:yes stop_codon:yes gene_type:complete
LSKLQPPTSSVPIGFFPQTRHAVDPLIKLPRKRNIATAGHGQPAHEQNVWSRCVNDRNFFFRVKKFDREACFNALMGKEAFGNNFGISIR